VGPRFLKLDKQTCVDSGKVYQEKVSRKKAGAPMGNVFLVQDQIRGVSTVRKKKLPREPVQGFDS